MQKNNLLLSKEILLDMDGTIVDFYGFKDWFKFLEQKSTIPYRESKPIYNCDLLNQSFELLRELGYRIKIVSWSSKTAGRKETLEIKKAKKEWLERYGILYDELHVVKYGTTKHSFIKADRSILIDDNDNILESFINSKRGKYKKIIDAKNNILEELSNLIISEIEGSGICEY